MTENKADPLREALVAFSDFINQPPQYEELHMVRDYRHELARKWTPLFDMIQAALASPQPAAPLGGRHPIEILWRKHDLPEWFLGNGGTNTKLYALYDAILAAIPQERGVDRAAIIEEAAMFVETFLPSANLNTEALRQAARGLRALGKETGR